MPTPRRDWTLLAIASARGETLTPVQLQKSLFLLGRRRSKAVGRSFYQFKPYNYGPFSRDVYIDAEQLAREGLVRIDHSDPSRSWAEYSATTRGIERAEQIQRSAPAEAVEYLEDAVEWTRGLTFQELVSSIYEAYPEQRANSVFR